MHAGSGYLGQYHYCPSYSRLHGSSTDFRLQLEKLGIYRTYRIERSIFILVYLYPELL